MWQSSVGIIFTLIIFGSSSKNVNFSTNVNTLTQSNSDIILLVSLAICKDSALKFFHRHMTDYSNEPH